MSLCGELLIGQLEFYWNVHLRPRLEGLERPLGPKGGAYADDSMLALVAHVNREVMHHGGEICLLRDLYRAGRATK